MKKKNNYSIYMNCRLSKKENKNLNKVMDSLRVYNKSKALRWLINNNEFIEKNNEGV